MKLQLRLDRVRPIALPLFNGFGAAQSSIMDAVDRTIEQSELSAIADRSRTEAVKEFAERKRIKREECAERQLNADRDIVLEAVVQDGRFLEVVSGPLARGRRPAKGKKAQRHEGTKA